MSRIVACFVLLAGLLARGTQAFTPQPALRLTRRETADRSLPSSTSFARATSSRPRRCLELAVASKKISKKKEEKRTPFLVAFFSVLRRVLSSVYNVLLFPLRYATRPLHSRFTSVPDIPSRFFGPAAPVLKGRAARVTDGDTIRFLHQPSRFHPEQLEKGQKLSEFCLPIRLATIDTPETAKFGKKGQPFGEEAKQHLKELLADQIVKVRLLKRDQYGRAVADVFIGGGGAAKRHADEQMLREGLAEVYVGGGAVYGPLGKDKYLELEAAARKKKKGIWSLDKRESAAEYKRRTKED